MRLIDADALMVNITSNHYPLRGVMGSIENGMFTVGIQQAVDEQPTIDAVPVVHGRWEKEYPMVAKHFKLTDGTFAEYLSRCSNCGAIYQYAPYRYCPSCGAKMDGGEESA